MGSSERSDSRADERLAGELPDDALDCAFGVPNRDSKAVADSVLDVIAEATGKRPQLQLHEQEAAGYAPLLKPLADDDAGEAGKYMVQGELGRGGVGVVHRGHDRDLGRDVAMKFLHERYKDNTAILHRFVEEAQIGGQLQHPGIVPVYDMGMSNERPFFAMKLIKGETLAKRFSERESTHDERHEFVSVFESVCQTVAYAHARGVVHRDLKPSNIMIGSFGEVQVVDWGMGKVLRTSAESGAASPIPASVIETVRSSDESARSVVGSVMGTPAYMSPEQARGDVDEMDERSDVFGLGAILCEILSGDPPYVGGDLIAKAAMAQLEGAYGRLAACEADPALIALTKSCLSPKTKDRPRSAKQVAEAVRAHLADVEMRVHTARIEAAEAKVKAVGLRRTQRLGVALLVVVISALVVTLSFWSDARAAAENERVAAESERKAKQLAVESEKEARESEQNAEFSAYVSALRAVAAHIDADELVRARAVLDECPENLRNWEWHHLHSSLDQSVVAVGVRCVNPSGSVMTLSGDGARLYVGDGKSLRAFDIAALVRGDREPAEVLSKLSQWGWGREWFAGVAADGERWCVIETVNDSSDEERRRRPRHEPTDKDRAELVVRGPGEHRVALVKGCGRSVVFAPGGDVVTGCFTLPRTEGSGSGVQKRRVWNATTGQVIHTFSDSFFTSDATQFHPDGSMLAVAEGKQRRSVTLWDMATGAERTLVAEDLPGGPGSRVFTAVAFDRKGERIAAAGSHFLVVWDLATGKVVSECYAHDPASDWEQHWMRAIAFRGDGRVIASSSGGAIHLWDVASGRRIRTLRGHTAAVHQMEFVPETNHLLSLSSDRTLRVWNTDALDHVGRKHMDMLAVLSDRNELLAVGVSGSGTIEVFDATTGAATDTIPMSPAMTSLVIDPEGKNLGAAGHFIQVLPTARDELPRSFASVPAFGSDVAWDHDGRMLEVAINEHMRLWDTRKGALLKKLGPEGDRSLAGARACAVRGFGWLVFMAGRASLWSEDLTAKKWSIKRRVGSSLSVPRLLDEKRVIVGAANGELVVIDVERGEVVHRIAGHEGGVKAVARMPGTNRVCSAGSDGMIRFWDTERWREVFSHNTDVTTYDIAVSDDGTVFAVARDSGITILRSKQLPQARVAEASRDRRLAQAIVDRLVAATSNQADRVRELREGMVLDSETRSRVRGLLRVYDYHDRRRKSGSQISTWYRVCCAGRRREAYEEVLERAEESASNHPGHEPYLTTLGAAYYRLDRAEDALQVLQRAVKASADCGRPTTLATSGFLALVLYRLDRREEAQSWRARCLEEFDARAAWDNVNRRIATEVRDTVPE